MQNTVLLHCCFTSMGNLEGLDWGFLNSHPVLYVLHLISQHHNVNTKPSRLWSLQRPCWSWAVWTLEAGTLDRWEERDALEKYKCKNQ